VNILLAAMNLLPEKLQKQLATLHIQSSILKTPRRETLHITNINKMHRNAIIILIHFAYHDVTYAPVKQTIHGEHLFNQFPSGIYFSKLQPNK